MTSDYASSLATPDDIPGILALQEPNLPDSGGKLSVRLTENWFKQAVADKSVVVGKRNDKVVGYVLGTSLAAKAHVPIIRTYAARFPTPAQLLLIWPRLRSGNRTRKRPCRRDVQRIANIHERSPCYDIRDS